MSGHWTTDEVAGHPVDIYEPTTNNGHGFVLIYLHGVHLQTLHDQDAFCTQFEQYGLPVVCPQTKQSWWADRICPEFDSEITAEKYVLDHILPYIERRWQATPPSIGLLGTSMGGQGALRFAYKYPRQFPVVAAISPAIDYHLRMKEGDAVLSGMYRNVEQARQETALLYVNPLNWPRHQFFCCCPEDERWFESADRLQMKLGSMGIPHDYDLETVGGGHGFAYYNLMAARVVGFIAERLDQERRRVV